MPTCCRHPGIGARGGVLDGYSTSPYLIVVYCVCSVINTTPGTFVEREHQSITAGCAPAGSLPDRPLDGRRVCTLALKSRQPATRARRLQRALLCMQRARAGTRSCSRLPLAQAVPRGSTSTGGSARCRSDGRPECTPAPQAGAHKIQSSTPSTGTYARVAAARGHQAPQQPAPRSAGAPGPCSRRRPGPAAPRSPSGVHSCPQNRPKYCPTSCAFSDPNPGRGPPWGSTTTTFASPPTRHGLSTVHGIGHSASSATSPAPECQNRPETADTVSVAYVPSEQ